MSPSRKGFPLSPQSKPIRVCVWAAIIGFLLGQLYMRFLNKFVWPKEGPWMFSPRFLESNWAHFKWLMIQTLGLMWWPGLAIPVLVGWVCSLLLVRATAPPRLQMVNQLLAFAVSALVFGLFVGLARPR
jgi:membrane associated rhomboid family serine protease